MDRHQIEAIHASAAGQRLAQRQPLPGSVYDEPAHVRMGFGRANLPEALRVLDENLAVA